MVHRFTRMTGACPSSRRQCVSAEAEIGWLAGALLQIPIHHRTATYFSRKASGQRGIRTPNVSCVTGLQPARFSHLHTYPSARLSEPLSLHLRGLSLHHCSRDLVRCESEVWRPQTSTHTTSHSTQNVNQGSATPLPHLSHPEPSPARGAPQVVTPKAVVSSGTYHFDRLYSATSTRRLTSYRLDSFR